MMEKDGKQRPETQLVPTRERKIPTHKWLLTDKDKKFLRSCNIRPE